jgi:hypothetical protein
MHVYIAAGNQRQLESFTDYPQSRKLPRLSAISQQFDSNPEAIAKSLAYPVVLDIEITVFVRNPQHYATGQTVFEGQSRQRITAFCGGTPGFRNHLAERGISGPVLCEHYQFTTALQV